MVVDAERDQRERHRIDTIAHKRDALTRPEQCEVAMSQG